MTKFNTITADDWRRAIARGRAEGNQVLSQIRAKVRELNYQRAAQTGFSDFPGVEPAPPAAISNMETKDNTITEAQVASWLLARASEFSNKCGREYVRVSISARVWEPNRLGDVTATAYVHAVPDGISIERPTLAEATSAAVLEVGKDHRAAALRAKAEAMLADAVRIEKGEL